MPLIARRNTRCCTSSKHVRMDLLYIARHGVRARKSENNGGRGASLIHHRDEGRGKLHTA